MYSNNFKIVISHLKEIFKNIKNNEQGLFPVFKNEDWPIITEQRVPVSNNNIIALYGILPFSKDLHTLEKSIQNEDRKALEGCGHQIIINNKPYYKCPLSVSKENVDSDIIDLLRTKYNIPHDYLTSLEWTELNKTDIWKECEIQIARVSLAKHFLKKHEMNERKNEDFCIQS